MECQEIPPFPAGNRFVETVVYGTEGVHPGICSLNDVSERQEFYVQKIFLIVFGMIVEIHICYDSGALALSSEIVTVKSGIGIEKKAVGGNTSVSHHAENLVRRSSNLMHVMMLTGFWLRYSHRNALTVSDKYGVVVCAALCAAPPTSSPPRRATVWLP